MGHSQAEKAETHRRIVGSASRLLRERGLFSLGVADVMKQVGLTVGGFYKHFASREAFVTEALSSIEGEWDRRVARGRDAGKRDAQILVEIIDGYLSQQHRDAAGSGCMFAAVGGDIARADAGTRAMATAKLSHSLDTLASLFSKRAGPDARGAAIMTFSALLGALTFARLVDDKALSREILACAAKNLKAWSAGASRGAA